MYANWCDTHMQLLDKYRLNDNVQSLVSYFWGVSDVLKLLGAACRLLPFNSGMRFCGKWRKSLTDGEWCWTVCLTKLVPLIFFCLSYFLLPILNNSDLNVYLKDVHVHQWNVPYSVPFSFGYLKQHWSKCLSQRCPCTSVKCSLLCSFFHWLT